MNEKSRIDGERRKDRGQNRHQGYRDAGKERGTEGTSAPARFDFTGWVRNNSANYYSTPVHIDRYVALIYILRGYDPEPTPSTFPTPSNPGINPGKAE